MIGQYKPDLRNASISPWLASAGHVRAWCCKPHLGLPIGRRLLRSSCSAWVTDGAGPFVGRHGMAIHTRTAFFKSP